MSPDRLTSPMMASLPYDPDPMQRGPVGGQSMTNCSTRCDYDDKGPYVHGNRHSDPGTPIMTRPAPRPTSRYLDTAPDPMQGEPAGYQLRTDCPTRCGCDDRDPYVYGNQHGVTGMATITRPAPNLTGHYMDAKYGSPFTTAGPGLLEYPFKPPVPLCGAILDQSTHTTATLRARPDHLALGKRDGIIHRIHGPKTHPGPSRSRRIRADIHHSLRNGGDMHRLNTPPGPHRNKRPRTDNQCASVPLHTF